MECLPKNVTYILYNESEIVYIGYTNDPEFRLREHELAGNRFTRMDLNSRPLTAEATKIKEAAIIKAYRTKHGGRLPRYNNNQQVVI